MSTPSTPDPAQSEAAQPDPAQPESAQPESAQPDAGSTTATTSLDTAYWRRRLTELIATYQVPGASLGVLHDGHITEVSAGLLSTATLVEATPDSVWQIGSISKVWTATLIMQLVDEGSVALDQPVLELLPDFALADAEAAAQITVRQLLNHTSGMDGDLFTDTGRGDDCVSKYVALLADLGQNHPVGATWSYCNSGYVVLGAIVERVTGQTWDEAIRSRISGPLGLAATMTLPEEAILHRAAVGHVGQPGQPPHPTKTMLLPRAMGPAGIITQQVHDLLCFARVHLAGGEIPGGGRLLSADAARQMTEHSATVPDPYSLGGDSWGLGWIRFDWDGHRLIGHDGSTIGQNAFLRILPEQEFAVALFTNGGRTRELYQAVFTELFAELAGVTMPAMFTPPEEPPELDITPWLGEYQRAGVDTSVFLDDGTPTMRATQTGPLAELEPDDAVHTFPLVPVKDGLYAAHQKETDTYLPVTFYQIDNGTRYVHFGVRANPLVAPASTDETTGNEQGASS